MLIKKSVLAILGVLVLTAGIAIGVLLVGQNQNPNKGAAPATTIFISPTNSEVGQNKNFAFWVKMDSGGNGLTGVDVRVNFDKNIFEVTSLEKGSSIGNLENVASSTFDNNAGTIKYIAYTTDKTKAITGDNLEVLRVNAKVKGNATLGVGNLSFDSLTAASATTETENVIANKTPGTLTVVSGNGANDIYIEGEPNSCGGTCGSNTNCKANFFCFDGFCRNPNCPNDKTCGCSTPTVTATIKPTLTPTKSPEVVYYNDPGTGKASTTLPPKATVTPIAQEDLETSTTGSDKAKKAILWIGIILGIIAVVLGIASLFKKKNDTEIPPEIPPTIS